MEGNNRREGNTVLLTIIGVATLLVALVGATFAYFTASIANNNGQSVSITTETPTALVYSGRSLELLKAVPGDITGAKAYVKTADATAQEGTTYYSRSESGNVVTFTEVSPQPTTGVDISELNYYVVSTTSNDTFTVTNPANSGGNTSSVNQSYDLTFVVDTNTFTKTHTYVSQDATEAARFEAAGVSSPTGSSTLTQTGQLVATITSNDATVANVSSASNVSTTSGGITIDLTDGQSGGTAAPGSSYQFVNDQALDAGQTDTYTMTVEFKELGKNQDENQGKSFGAHIVIDDPKSINPNA